MLCLMQNSLFASIEKASNSLPVIKQLIPIVRLVAAAFVKESHDRTGSSRRASIRGDA